ncbi:MAG: phage tail assembly protein [Deltaproteobacteria bacterium]|nr:phage tail assembly protein [Deltaproteobacteria bacterium]
MAFQTEYRFKLPRGYVDPEGNLHRDGVMRLATAKDEIVPLQDYRVQGNRAYLVVILLSRVITKLGDIKYIDTETIENLFSTDLAYLQEFYRKINEEGSPRVHAKCPKCENEFDIDLVTGQVIAAPAEGAEGGEGRVGQGG